MVTPSEVEESQGQSIEGCLWDVLWMARIAIGNADPHEHIAPFEVLIGEETDRLVEGYLARWRRAAILNLP